MRNFIRELRRRSAALLWLLAVAGAIAHLAGASANPPRAEIPVAQATDPQVKAVIDKMAAAGVLHPTTVEEVRKAYAFYPTLAGKPEHVLRVEEKKIPGPAGEIPIRVYVPREGGGLPVLVFFHGGGFVAGDLNTADTPLRAIANRCGCLIVSVAYRLAPENLYPAAVDDAYAATKWVSVHAAELGGDVHRIAVAGDGAGGNLAAVVALMSRDRGGPPIIFQVLIYPTLDASVTSSSTYLSADPIVTPEARAAILGSYIPLTHNLMDPYISPIYAKTLKGLPPALIVTDEDDPSRDEGDAYARKLVIDDVPVKVSRYPNMIHGFFLMAGQLDAGKKCIDEIAVALVRALKSAPASAASD
jgi:acetyl esterase